jgi:hypothetical protein
MASAAVDAAVDVDAVGKRVEVNAAGKRVEVNALHLGKWPQQP